MLQRLFTGLAVFLAGTTLANATVINLDGAEQNLQEALDERTVGGEFLDVNEDQAALDELWTLASSGAGQTLMLFEIAGNASLNKMGIYDPSNVGTTLELFAGDAGAGARVFLVEDSTGVFKVCSFTLGCSSTVDFGGSTFGFYLDSPFNDGTRFYSEAVRNTDSAEDGTTDHMVAFEGDGSLYIDPLLNGNSGPFWGEYIIAWEDQLLSDSDRDYQDMVVLIESIVPVPEPGPLALFGAALLALGIVRIKSRAV